MTDSEIMLICELRQLQRDMLAIAAQMRTMKGAEIRKHAGELAGAAYLVGDWIQGIEEGHH